MYKVAVVEDKMVIRNQIAKFIDEYADGFTVTNKFSDGRRVIEFLEKDTCDVIVTDVKMLDVSGLEVARYIFENELPVRVIIISGYQEFSYAQKAMDYNVYSYLTKPTDPEELKKILDKLKVILDKENGNIQNTPKVKIELCDDINEERKIVERILKYIDGNFGSEVSLKSVSNTFHLSESYLSRIFKRNTGKNFSNYLIAVRMENAKDMLRTGQYTVNDVSEKVGYSNANYFIQVFKNYTGYTPKKYIRSEEE